MATFLIQLSSLPGNLMVDYTVAKKYSNIILSTIGYIHTSTCLPTKARPIPSWLCASNVSTLSTHAHKGAKIFECL